MFVNCSAEIKNETSLILRRSTMGNILRKSIQVGGRAMTLETGRMAKTGQRCSILYLW